MKFLADFKVLSIACVIVALAFAGGIAYDLNGQSFDFSNSHPVLVVSDSMDGDVIGYDIDSFPSNTLVMVQELADYEKGFLREGDVIAYHNGSMLSVHRVVKVDDGYVYVHGDNNHSTEMISVADVEGRIVGASHILGEIASFIGGNVFLFLVVGFAICSVPIVLRVYTAPRSQKCSGAPSRALTVVALLAVVAMVFVGVGAAYTASTENSGNTVTSEYVVLSQTSYSFTDNTLQYDVVTNELGTAYQLRYVTELVAIDNQMYYGVQVGNSDTLQADAVGSDKTDVNVKVNTTVVAGSLFTDFSDFYDWRYILKIEGNGDLWYAYYDGSRPLLGSNTVEWTILKRTGTSPNYTYSKVDALALKVSGEQQYTYTTSLFFAGIGETVNDGSFVKAVGSIAKFSSDAVITPVWVPSEDGDFSITLKSNYPANATGMNDQPLTEKTRKLFFNKGDTMMLPENQFESEIKVGDTTYVFAGWYSDKYNRTYSPRYSFSMTEDREFEANWVVKDSASVMAICYIADNTAEMDHMTSGTVPGYWFPWNKRAGTAGSYTLPDNPDQRGGFIILVDQDVTGLNGITVVKVKSTTDITFETGKDLGDDFKGSWKVWNTEVTPGDYTVLENDLKDGFIVLVDSGVTGLANYEVITITNGATGHMNVDHMEAGGYYSFAPNEYKKAGKRFAGWTINDPDSKDLYPAATYMEVPYNTKAVTLYAQWETDTVDDEYKALTFRGYINFEQKDFVVYTDKEGKYLLPDCFFGPAYELPDATGKTGWKCIGWTIKSGNKAGYAVAQSYTKPAGVESDQIIKSGTIKFVYDSEWENP